MATLTAPTARRSAIPNSRSLRDERILDALLETLDALVVVLDSRGRIVRFNRACETLTGYAAEEMQGRPVWDVLLPRDEVRPVRRVFARLRSGDFPNYHENDWLTRSGERRRVAWSNTALLDEGGRVQRVLATGIDVTETRRAERERLELGARARAAEAEAAAEARALDAVREAELTLRRLYEITADPAADFDAKLHALLAFGCERFGLPIGILARVDGERYEVAALHGSPGTIAEGAVLPLGQTYCRDTLRRTSPVAFVHAGASVWRAHPCYDAFALEAYLATPVRTGDRVFGTLNFSSPTPRSRPFTEGDQDLLRLMAQWVGGEVARRELATREEALRAETERLKDEFLANVSHDFRTPIAAIKASLGVVLENPPAGMDRDLARLLANADVAADHLLSLVEDLLELARLRTGGARLSTERIDLRRLVRRVAAEIEPLARTRGQRVSVTQPPQPIYRTVDSARLERAPLNLAGNAHRHGRDGGAIEIGVLRRDGEITLWVGDDGPGIAADDTERIFERFFRVPDLAAPASGGAHGTRGVGGAGGAGGRGQGSGLGLAIAKGMVALHGGRIWVESAPGAGATFWIALPTRRRASGRTPTVGGASAPRRRVRHCGGTIPPHVSPPAQAATTSSRKQRAPWRSMVRLISSRRAPADAATRTSVPPRGTTHQRSAASSVRSLRAMPP